jgi:hypothetical protein
MEGIFMDLFNLPGACLENAEVVKIFCLWNHMDSVLKYLSLRYCCFLMGRLILRHCKRHGDSDSLHGVGVFL